MAAMDVPRARLEDWMRWYYHAVDHDIGSSGVRDLTVQELRELCGFDLAELDDLVFHDSESFGGTQLRGALADRWTGGEVDRVMVTHGSSEAIYIVMHTLLGPGDVVVVVEPAYQQLYDIAAALGCRIVRWPLRPQDGFAVDVAALRTLVSQCRPHMVVVNFPHNPTGVTITRGQQQELVAIAAQAGAWLVWDHAFGELTFDSVPLPLPTDWYRRCIAFGTFSKSYGLAGIRVGWCVAPREVLARMAVLRDYIALYVSPLLEFFAERAVRHAERIVALQRRHAGANRRVLLDWAHAMGDRVRLVAPAGGVTAFVELSDHGDTTDLCERLARRDRVLLVPGACFGDAYASYVRLGFGGTRAELGAGLAALAGALHARDDTRVGV